uniref:Uncharacterized protein n=1 Tax=Aureoumbra lagunensis TaxID=44058 RepID=A0A7S3JTX6_9STRA
MDDLLYLLNLRAPIARFFQQSAHSPSLTTVYDCETNLSERLGWATSVYVAWNKYISSYYADEILKIENLFGQQARKHVCATGLLQGEYLCVQKRPNSWLIGRRNYSKE